MYDTEARFIIVIGLQNGNLMIARTNGVFSMQRRTHQLANSPLMLEPQKVACVLQANEQASWQANRVHYLKLCA